MADAEKPDRSVSVVSNSYEDAPVMRADTLVLRRDDEDVRHLRGFATLAPNWNSYGAKPIAPTAIAAAEKLLVRVVRMFGVRPDIVAPVATGSVHLEWSGAKAEIDVRANPDGTYSCLYTHGDTSDEMHGATIGQVFDCVSRTLIN